MTERRRVTDDAEDRFKVTTRLKRQDEDARAGSEHERERLLFEAIASATQDAIIVLDFEGNISFWNDAATSIFQYERREVLGKSLHEMLARKEDLAAHRGAFPEFQRTGRGPAVGKVVELIALRKDGKQISVEMSLSSVRLAERWRAIAIVRDVTARREMEDRLRVVSHAVHQSPVAIVITDAAGVVEFVNAGYTETTGYTAEETIGRRALLLRDGDLREEHLEDPKNSTSSCTALMTSRISSECSNRWAAPKMRAKKSI